VLQRESEARALRAAHARAPARPHGRPRARGAARPFSSRTPAVPNVACARPRAPAAQNIFALYKLGKELGRGQFGTVQECFDLKTNQKYACKVISKHKIKCAPRAPRFCAQLHRARAALHRARRAARALTGALTLRRRASPPQEHRGA
jgi:serine/threonine protein kinase